MEIPFSSSVLCSSVCSVFGSASGASPHGAREEGQKARILEARRRLDARVRVEPRRTRSCGGPCVFGRESAREAVRGAVDDDPFGESPLEKPLEPAGRLGERDGVLGESGREMEGLSRKQDTKSFEVCVRHVTVDLEGREGACGGGRGDGPENVRFVCVDDGGLIEDGAHEEDAGRACDALDVGVGADAGLGDEAPDGDDTPRLPCLAILRPAPAAASAVIVETLIVPAPSPPVPTISPTSKADFGKGLAARSIAAAAPRISSSVSPFIFRAVRRDASSGSLMLPAKTSVKRVSVSAALRGCMR